MHEIVVIEDSTIASMVRDPRFTAAIPCLQNQQAIVQPQAAGGCGSCARKREAAQRAALANIKMCLSGLSQDKKNELKQLLDAKQVKVVFATVSGQIATTTF
jgi:hypothetical protein